MSKFSIPPIGWTADSTEAENIVRKIFYNHWEKMKNQLQTTVHMIDTWRQKTIEEINKHADDQMRILADEYDRQRSVLDGKREESLEITRAYRGAENTELFNDLRSAYLSLEFQVAQLEYVISPMNTPRIITIQEQMERSEKERSDVLKPEASKPEEKPIIESANNIQDNQSVKKDEYNNSASTISNATQPHSSVVESLNDNNQSISTNNECQARIVHDDGSTNKCPICFMMFPLSMSPDDRSQHVNEHYTDD